MNNNFVVHLCFLKGRLYGPWAIGSMFDKDPYQHTLSQHVGLEHITTGLSNQTHTMC